MSKNVDKFENVKKQLSYPSNPHSFSAEFSASHFY